MVTKNDFVKRVAEATDGVLTQRQVNAAMEAMGTVITEIVKAQDSVKVCGVVTLSGVQKDACTRRNPATGASVDVPAKTAPKAKFASNFKSAINE